MPENPFMNAPAPPANAQGMVTPPVPAEISLSLHELIPTVQFGNVTIGPVVITRQCPDTPEDRRRVMQESYAEAADVIATKRGELLLMCQNAAKAFGG